MSLFDFAAGLTSAHAALICTPKPAKPEPKTGRQIVAELRACRSVEEIEAWIAQQEERT